MRFAPLLAVLAFASPARADLGCVGDISQAAPDGSFCRKGSAPRRGAAPVAAPAPSLAPGIRDLNNAAAGAIGTVIGGALVPALPPIQGSYGTLRDKQFDEKVDDGSDSANSPGVRSAQDLLKDYGDGGAKPGANAKPAAPAEQDCSDPNVVCLKGTTPSLLRAADQRPRIAGSISEIAGFNAPPDVPIDPSSVGAVTSKDLKDWSAKAGEKGKELIAKAAELQEKFADSAAGKTVEAAGVMHDTLELFNSHPGASEGLTQALDESGNVLTAADRVTTGIKLANACANAGADQCQGAAWGAGLSIAGGGIPLQIGAGLGAEGLRAADSRVANLNQAYQDLGAGGASPFVFSPEQQKLHRTAEGFFGFFK